MLHVIHFLDNSLRYTNSGGIIKVRAKLRKRNYIRISVYDTGSGIKPEEFHSLGRINNNINDLHKTTCGFGLFISNILCLLIERKERKEADKKKGLTVYSEVGVGTCFNFSFRCDLNSDQCCETDKRKNRHSNSLEKKEIKLLSISSSEFIVEKSCFSSKENKYLFFPHKEDKRSLDQAKCRANTLKPAYSLFDETRNSMFLQRDSINSNSPSLKHDSFSNMFDSSTFARSECNCSKVLIVDDGPFNIEACSRLLAKMKISFDSASNGLEAVEKIAYLTSRKEMSSPINSEVLNEKYFVSSSSKEILKNRRFCNRCRCYKLILMDIDMPIKNGIEATEEILFFLKRIEISVNIVGLSAFDQEDIVKRSMEAGMVDFVTKPMKHTKLKEIISKYLSIKM